MFPEFKFLIETCIQLYSTYYHSFWRAQYISELQAQNKKKDLEFIFNLTSCGLKKLTSLSPLPEGSSDCGWLFQSLKKAEVDWGSQG